MIGYGYWGQNLLRNLCRMENASVKIVSELSPRRKEKVKRLYPHIATVSDYRKVLDNSFVDAVVIATPATSHYSLAKKALECGKHVFVEKPLAMKTGEARELIKLSQKSGKLLMVGHTFVYNPAVNFLRNYILSGELGEIYYTYSQRLNLGIVREDINVMWNLAPHDLSILMYLLGSEPIEVSVKGVCHLQDDLEDVTFMNLTFSNGISSHIHVSWLDPNKVRRMTIVGDRKMVVYDDISDYKIMIFDKGITRGEKNVCLGEYDTFGHFQLIKRAGDVVIPHIDYKEPLQVECQHFVECILYNQEPITNGYDGYRVVKVLEAAQKSLDREGQSIYLNARRRRLQFLSEF